MRRNTLRYCALRAGRNQRPGFGWGYREFQAHIGHCRFNDCRHINDKGCAVREGVENGEIATARHQRYLKLLDKLAQPDTVWE